MSEGVPVLVAQPLDVVDRQTSYQTLLSRVPYVVRRRVRWADCDAGGIVYTPNFLGFAVETAESWFEAMTGVHWSALAPVRRIGHPYVSCNLTFKKMLACNDEFDMAVKVTDIRERSYA